MILFELNFSVVLCLFSRP